MFCFLGLVSNWSIAVGSSVPTTAYCRAAFFLRNQTPQAISLFIGHHFPSTHSTFPVPVTPFQPSYCTHCVFHSILPAFQAYLTPVLLARAAGLSVSLHNVSPVLHPPEQAQELLPRTGANYRVQLIRSNLLLWEVAAPGSSLHLYFSAPLWKHVLLMLCSFLEVSFHNLHSSTR